MAESEEELKSLLISVKEESEKASLKLSTQKTKIMAFSPIMSWHIDGGKVEGVTDFIFLGSKIMVNGDCKPSNEKIFAPWKKNYDKPRQRVKSRDITLLTKVHIWNGMIFQ